MAVMDSMKRTSGNQELLAQVCQGERDSRSIALDTLASSSRASIVGRRGCRVTRFP
jgi:hypothetical protein